MSRRATATGLSFGIETAGYRRVCFEPSTTPGRKSLIWLRFGIFDNAFAVRLQPVNATVDLYRTHEDLT
jgi:hypothetical protein